MKKLIVMLIVLTSFFCLGVSNGQDIRNIDITLLQKEIDGDNFSGHVNLIINNASSDTLYIVVHPFNYDIIGNSNGINVYVEMLFQMFAPNRIVFFKRDIPYLDARGGSKITYSKFPNILFLTPGMRTEIILYVSEINLEELKGSIWDVSYDLWYASKKDLDTSLITKPIKIKQEFEKSLFYKDVLDLNMVKSKQSNTSDSLIYSYKTEKGSPSFYNKNETIYDSVLRCFNRHQY